MLAGLLFQAAWVAVLLHGAQGRVYTGRRKLANFAVERYPSAALAAAAANIRPPNGDKPCRSKATLLSLLPATESP